MRLRPDLLVLAAHRLVRHVQAVQRLQGRAEGGGGGLVLLPAAQGGRRYVAHANFR